MNIQNCPLLLYQSVGKWFKTKINKKTRISAKNVIHGNWPLDIVQIFSERVHMAIRLVQSDFNKLASVSLAKDKEIEILLFSEEADIHNIRNIYLKTQFI